MTEEEKIMTLHPQGKKGVNISRRKYEQIKNFILTALKQESLMTFETLADLALKELAPQFDGKVLWYLVTVKLDLEARKIIGRVPNTKPQKLQLY